jgi:hypothetical protein
MTASLKTLLAGILDYAGIFPPAKLPLDQAIRHYARYRSEPENWMLGCFICPAARLAELAPFHGELFQAGRPFAFSALGRSGSNTSEFLAGLDADRKDIAAFRERHGDRIVVNVYETRLPATVLPAGQEDEARRLLATIARNIEDMEPPAVTAFYEIPLGAAWRSCLTSFLTLLAGNNRPGMLLCRESWRPAGFKLRCGGLEAAAFPSPEQVAFTITACRDAAVSLKCTAGLHHPIRHFDASVQTHVHGFLNVFGAGVLASARNLAEADVLPILVDEDASRFVFDEQGFHWKDLQATPEEITRARQQAVISFGSCSFDEPREDLHALGLLRSG